MSVLGSPIAPATLAMTTSVESSMFGAFEAVFLQQFATKFVSISSPGRRRQQRLQNAHKQVTAQFQFSSIRSAWHLKISEPPSCMGFCHVYFQSTHKCVEELDLRSGYSFKYCLRTQISLCGTEERSLPRFTHT